MAAVLSTLFHIIQTTNLQEEKNMNKWSNPTIDELNIVATENQPSAEIAVDDLINGVFTFGKRDGSGPAGEVIFTPTDF